MINKKYLEQALRIRKDFKSTDNDLLSVRDKLIEINNQLEKTLKDLETIRSNTDKYTTNESFQSDVMVHLEEFERQSNIANEIYKPLNENIEKLKIEEQNLYKTLLSEYPHLDESIIIQEVQDYVKKRFKF
jgi:hypothetical protein